MCEFLASGSSYLKNEIQFNLNQDRRRKDGKRENGVEKVREHLKLNVRISDEWVQLRLVSQWVSPPS